MDGILMRTLVTMLGLFLASRLIPGVWIEGTLDCWFIGPDGRYEILIERRC